MKKEQDYCEIYVVVRSPAVKDRPRLDLVAAQEYCWTCGRDLGWDTQVTLEV